MAKHGKSIEQVIFDRIVKHLYKQGKQSRSSSGLSCMYRGEEGCSCAIGRLISDKQYCAALEYQPADVSEVVTAVEKSLKLGPLTDRAVAVMCACQYVHDAQYVLYHFTSRDSYQHNHECITVNSSGKFNTNLAISLSEVAKYFKLDFNPPKKYKLEAVAA